MIARAPSELFGNRRWAAAAAAVVVIVVCWVIGAAVLPNGLPLGVLVLGLVLGSLTSLTAMGLVLIYRANRVINFAQVEMGGLASVVALLVVIGFHLPYGLGVVLGLVAAVATGAVIDLVVVRRFEKAPRLILTVATIGILQILGGAEIGLPSLFKHLRPLTTFHAPLRLTITIGPVLFHGDDVIAVGVVPIVLLALGWFLYRSDVGTAIRAAADSGERALLLGIPVRRLSTITWMVAGGLSGLGLILASPIKGPNLGVVGGPPLLLAPLAAAVIARMERLGVAIVAAIGIGVFEQAVFWNYPRSAVVDVALFVAILLALLLQRRGSSRGENGDDIGRFAAVHEVRPIPAALASLREVRIARIAVPAAAAAVLLALPWLVSASTTILLAYTLMYGIIATSLVVLAGWAGQISLGQFAFVGVGAAVTGSLLVHQGTDLFVALALSMMAGAVAALLVGVPALRIRGLFLAATTLAFAVPVSTFLLNSGYFPTLDPRSVEPPLLLKRFSLADERNLYYFAFVALVGAIFVSVNLRRSRAGRALLAVRDNEPAAAAHAVDPTRTKLFAFAFSGALAGFAGGLFVVANRGISFAGFNPILSVEAFTAVVVGGLGSIPGALLGAAYIHFVQDFLGSTGELLASGAGLLFLVMVVPGGIGEIVFSVRDRLLKRVAEKRGIELPAPAAAGSDVDTDTVELTAQHEGLLSTRGVSAGYGGLQVLFGIDMDLDDGAPTTLLGTNGAGKSTILRVLSGVLPATSGRVLYDGKDITMWSASQRLGAGIVMVPGGRGVFPSLTVAENLRMAGWLRRNEKDALAEGLERVYALFPILRERAGQSASSLSGGEQQMLTLAQALLCRPRLLMIDELSIGLAPAVVSELVSVVERLRQDGVTLLVVEQSLNVAARIADRAVFIEKGRVRFTGSISRLLSRRDLARAVFLRRPEGRSRARAVSDGVIFAANGVVKHFGGVFAVSDVDIDVRRGEILGIIGPNGAGKSTFINVCSGFLPADSGTLSFVGEEVGGLSASELAERGIGRTFQDARLWPSLTVREALAVALDRHVDVRDPFACVLRGYSVVVSERQVAGRADELLETMGLGPYRDTFVSELSTGTRRILEIACAIAHGPELLFLDEPTGGVAERESEVLGELLRDLRDTQGVTLVVVEHNIPVVSSISDRLVCLDLGAVLATGTPNKVLSDAAVLESYLGSNGRQKGAPRRKAPPRPRRKASRL